VGNVAMSFWTGDAGARLWFVVLYGRSCVDTAVINCEHSCRQLKIVLTTVEAGAAVRQQSASKGVMDAT
jgi:hypothetical protein